MVFKGKKIVLFKFLPYEYKSLEEYLEKMALHGWMLENIQGYYLKFNKSQPKRIKYSVDIMDSISFLDDDSEKVLEYRDYCKEAGWNYICSSDKIQIYCSESVDNIVDIHTDEIEKFNIIAKASFKYCCLNMITLMCILLTQYISTIGNYNANFLASIVSLSGLVFASVFSLHEILGIIAFLIFIIKRKISISKGSKVSYNFKNIVLIRRLLHSLLFMLILIISTYIAIAYDIEILKMVSIIIIIVIIINYLVKFIKNKDYKNKKLLISLIYLIGILIMFFTISNNIVNNSFIRSYIDDTKSLEKVKHLTLGDFDDIRKDDSIYYDLNQSPIALHLFYSDEGQNIYLSYDIFDSKYKWPVEYNFNKKMKFANKNGIEYIEKETNFPNDIKVYMNEHGHQYIIVSENKMVEIFTIEGVSENELINTVYEKVFKTK